MRPPHQSFRIPYATIPQNGAYDAPHLTAGFVHSIYEKDDYHGWYFSSNGGVHVGISGNMGLGLGGSIFWTPFKNKNSRNGMSYGWKFGVYGASDGVTYSTSATFYYSGPFEFTKKVRKWLSENVTPPPKVASTAELKQFAQQVEYQIGDSFN